MLGSLQFATFGGPANINDSPRELTALTPALTARHPRPTHT